MCGWEVPATHVNAVCPVCRTPYDSFTCIRCRKKVPISERTAGRNWCKACDYAAHLRRCAAYQARVNALLDSHFEEWLSKVRRVPKNYPTLTEEQWIEACRYFCGCARCGSEDITARGFFIGFDIGGRYCDWNVIPLCDKCAGSFKESVNQFIYTRNRGRNTKSAELMDCLWAIVEYLGGKLDRALESGGKPSE